MVMITLYARQQKRHTQKKIKKGNHKRMKHEPTEWEKIYANEATDKGLISKLHKQLMTISKNK